MADLTDRQKAFRYLRRNSPSEDIFLREVDMLGLGDLLPTK